MNRWIVAAPLVVASLILLGCEATDSVVSMNGEARALTITIVAEAFIVVEGLTLEEGETASLGTMASNALGQTVGEVEATWSSENPTIASVTRSGGVVTGHSEGTTTVTALYQNITASIEVTVEPSSVPTEPPANIAPVAVIESPGRDTTVTLGDALCFLGDPRDEDGVVVSHDWRFGDGNTAEVEDPCDYEYLSAGSYLVRYAVADDQGATHATTRTVTVADPTGPPPPPPPSPTGDLLVASNWAAGDWSDGGKWGNASASVQDGHAIVVAGEAGEPWDNKLRINVSDSNNSWIQMVLDGGPAPELGQPVTIRWYERILLPDSWNGDPLTHGIALGSTNGGQPWLNYWTRTDGTYRMEVQVLNDFDPMFSLPDGSLNKGQWYRMEWTTTQETASRLTVAIHVYDLAGNEIFGPTDFTNWPWADGRTDLSEMSWAFDVRPQQTSFVGWNSGLSGLDREVTWAEYAAVAIVLGDSVGPYDPARGY